MSISFRQPVIFINMTSSCLATVDFSAVETVKSWIARGKNLSRFQQ